MATQILPKSHPRYQSLYYRWLLVEGVKQGITSIEGLIAHGRGEAFDYLLGEKTHPFALQSIKAAAAMLLLANYPVISVNGNTAVLVPKELVFLARILPAELEVNLFHRSCEREQKIVAHLRKFGANKVLLADKAAIPGIRSSRRWISSQGQKKADVVFVPLEDGDRTWALVAMGKKVIAVDLNPLSRTACSASITIVDNIVRVMPLLVAEVKRLQTEKPRRLEKMLGKFDNRQVLQAAEKAIRKAIGPS